MNITKKEYEDNILILAEFLGAKYYKTLIKNHYTLPELTKDIIYDLFLGNVLNDERIEYEVKILHLYVIELQTKGFVDFN